MPSIYQLQTLSMMRASRYETEATEIGEDIELTERGRSDSVADLLAFHMNIKSHSDTTTFSSLPTELRLMIWAFAIPPSTIHRISLHLSPYTRGSSNEHAYPISAPRIPTILHINHESRSVGLSIFKLGFSAFPSKTLFQRFPKTYWDPVNDSLYLPSIQPPKSHNIRLSLNFGEAFDEDGISEHTVNPTFPLQGDASQLGYSSTHSLLSLVQNLALPWNHRVASGMSLDSPWLLRWLSSFPQLLKVTFLIDHFPAWYRAGEIVVWEAESVELEDGLALGLGGEKGTLGEICEEVEKRMREWKENENEMKGWGTLVVEVLIMGNRKTRTVGEFCVKSKSKAAGEGIGALMGLRRMGT